MVYKINKVAVGHRIESIRKSLNMSMAEFADKIGVTRGAVNNYEKGRVIPKSAVLKKIISLDNSSHTSLTEEEFLYGDFRKYLSDVLSELPDFCSNPKWENVLNELEMLYIAKEIDYGKESEIFRAISIFDDSLASSDEFHNLWAEYIKQQKEFRVNSDKIFSDEIIPLFEQDFLELDELKKEHSIYFIKSLLSALRKRGSFASDFDFAGEISRCSDDILEDITYLYDDDEIDKLSEDEKRMLAFKFAIEFFAWKSFLTVWADYSYVPLDKFLRFISESRLLKNDPRKKDGSKASGLKEDNGK